MPESELRETLHQAVHRYLSTLTAIGDCFAQACPPVGGPYRHKLTRLRTRLAFDTNPESLTESFEMLEADLREYAGKASHYLDSHRVEVARAVSAIGRMARDLDRRQAFYQSRLRQLAENGASDAAEESLQEAAEMKSAALLACLDSMNFDTKSMIAAMVDELNAVEPRIADIETTDPVTHLTNRTEMERQIEAHRAEGLPVTLLMFELTGNVADEVAQQVALRLVSQFRPHDVISRWAPNEFLVLFKGPPEIAEMRVTQVVPWVAGRYPLDNGGVAEIGVEARLTEAETVAA